MFEYQDPVILDQINPTQNTYYEIGGSGFWATKKNIRILRVVVNIEDTNETLEVKLTIDGKVIDPIAVAVTHSTSYYVYIGASGISLIDYNTISNNYYEGTRQAFLIEGHTAKVEVRKTTAAGTGHLTGIVLYEVLKPVS